MPAAVQLLVEVPPTGADPLDLSGDAGAVGRFSANTSGDSGSAGFLLDLKGTVYNASLAGMPCTALVVNMTGQQAKVRPGFQPVLVV